MKKGKYLITGCAGFIGSHLVKNLYRNHKLILVDDLSEGSIINLPKILRKKLIKTKIQNIKNLKTKKLNGIFHLAAQASVPLSLKNYYLANKNSKYMDEEKIVVKEIRAPTRAFADSIFSS